MRICIYGAGAIGGYVGAQLALAGEDVSLIARGPHLEAMQKNGLRVRSEAGEQLAHPRCTDDPAELGHQDYVIITLKAHSVPQVLTPLQELLGPETTVVTASNGVPWWYFYGQPGPWENQRLESVDPGGRQWDAIGPERALGAVVYPAVEVIEPGVIQHLAGDRFILGEPTNEKSPRAVALSDLLIAAGLRAPIRDIRHEIWVKLWGNVAFNPISALTLQTLDVITGDPETRGLARVMMLEAQAIAEKLGIHFRIDVDRRIEGAAKVGAHKTSMLQDLELGRPLEIDALVRGVQEIGRLVGVATPTIDAVLALVSLRAKAGNG